MNSLLSESLNFSKISNFSKLSIEIDDIMTYNGCSCLRR